METIEKFIDQGIQVNVVYTDVCEFEHLKKTIDEVKTNMPPIKGVVHTAGVLNDKMLTHLAWNEFEKVLNPKVAGTLNIYNTVNMEELDFFMMLSSITSIVGNMGQANYASANYFMNAFAVHLGMEGLPGFTFCWGPFMESGMAAGKDAVANTMEKMGMKTFGKEQGCKIIEDFMDQPYENLLIADVVWNSLGDSLKHAAGKNEFLSKLISEVNMKEVSEPDGLNSDIVTILENLSEEERKDFLIDKLQGICGKIMGYEKGLLLSVDEAFQVQGADSLMIFSMRTAVNKLLGTDVNVAVFFNYPSIVKLAEYLLDEILILEEDDMVAITTEAESESIEEILSEISMLTL
jgi:short-subunit dehydrogenase